MEENENKALIKVTSPVLPVATEKPEGYFGAVARRYRNVFRVLLITLVLFAVLFVLFFSRAFTYDSLYYFVKDLSGIAAAVSADCDEVSYAYHEGNSSFGLYQGGIVRVSTAGVEIFRSDGERALYAELTLKEPRLALSRRYVIAYDFGGTDFYVYNSYDKLYHGETDAPILGITVSDSGAFAVLTPSEKALSSVLYYDSGFALTQRFERGSATLDMALSENGEKIAFLGLGTDGGLLDVYEIGGREPTATVSLSVGLPETVLFLTSKNIAVVGENGALVLQTDGKTLENISFGGKSPVLVAGDEHGFAVALCEKNMPTSTGVLLLDKKGDVLFSKEFDCAVSGLALSGKTLFVLSGEKIQSFSSKGEELGSISCAEGTEKIFAVSGTRVAAVRRNITAFYAVTE